MEKITCNYLHYKTVPGTVYLSNQLLTPIYNVCYAVL